MDLTVAGSAAVILLPVFVAVTILILACSGRPVFFTQERPGLNGRIFRILKFRTMITDVSDELPDSERITPLGRWLRLLSLDEVPQLWNILRGEMSLVGPRPLLPHYTIWLTDTEQERFRVRPGLTGWAQINGRNTASWNDRLAMDVWYVRNRNVLLDLKILALTLSRVLQRRDLLISTSRCLDLDQVRRREANLANSDLPSTRKCSS